MNSTHSLVKRGVTILKMVFIMTFIIFLSFVQDRIERDFERYMPLSFWADYKDVQPHENAKTFKIWEILQFDSTRSINKEKVRLRFEDELRCKQHDQDFYSHFSFYESAQFLMNKTDWYYTWPRTYPERLTPQFETCCVLRSTQYVILSTRERVDDRIESDEFCFIE